MRGGRLGLEAEIRGCDSGYDRLSFATSGGESQQSANCSELEGTHATNKLFPGQRRVTAAARCWRSGAEVAAPDGGHDAARQDGE
jgi:hypothetical protein